MRICSTIILLTALFSGCSRTSTSQSDLSGSLQKELASCGIALTNADSLPAVHAQWTVTPDDHGFVAFVPGDHFPEVDAWLHRAFGEPKMSEEKNSEGQPQRIYDLRVAGLQCIGESNGVQIVCVTKQSK